MRMGKPKTEQLNSIEEVEAQKFFQDSKEEELFVLDNDLTIHEAKELLSQQAATIDYGDDGSGKPKSVKITRVLDKKVIFYSEQERDIKKFLD